MKNLPAFATATTLDQLTKDTVIRFRQHAGARRRICQVTGVRKFEGHTFILLDLYDVREFNDEGKPVVLSGQRYVAATINGRRSYGWADAFCRTFSPRQIECGYVEIAQEVRS